MRIHFMLPPIALCEETLSLTCPTPGCHSTQFRLHQRVEKQLHDLQHQHVVAQRYRCINCGCTFRVYPRGVTHAPTSQRVQHIAVLLYFLGLSYAAVSAALEALKVYMCKSRVYDAVLAAGQSSAPPRVNVFERMRRSEHNGSAVEVWCNARWLPLTLTADDDVSMLTLHVAALAPNELAQLQQQLQPLAGALGVAVQHEPAQMQTVGEQLLHQTSNA